MGDLFLFGLIVAFWIYEAVMHFVFRNRVGYETLSSLIWRLERSHPWLRHVVLLACAALAAHLAFHWF